MNIYFLSAEKPIVKRYELDPKGELQKHSYPFVYEVTSHEEHPKGLPELATLMQRYSKTGATLVKGELSRQLVTESRKGTTDPTAKTDWICLDLDGVDNYQTVDLFLEDIGCGDTDYIVQWSSSMGIENNAGFRCHIFMRLDQECHPQILKYWLMDINLSTPSLSAQLDLTKTGNSLRWPLDITTCQNDKLLYISPPELGKGIKDPFPGNKRITFVKRKHRALVLPYPIPGKDALRERMEQRITELRIQHQLPKKKAIKYKFAGATEYMVNPDSATITEMKTERGFVYFNLNGGNSWAYYHPEDNPNFVFNFKGEPAYKTEDLLPEYWASLQQAASNYQPNSQGIIYLAFREFRTGNYYNGTYDTGTDKLNLAMAKSESQLRQFMKQYGQQIGEFVPDWNLVWDPHSTSVVNPTNNELNTFQPSEFFLKAKLPKTNQIPPTIKKVIDHVLGHDPDTIDHFINWLACIVQYQTRTGTAWVWQGTQGCLAGDTVLQFATPTKRLRPSTVKQAFEKWTGKKNRGPRAGKCWNVSKGIRTKSVRDGHTIGYHEIFDIVESGVKPLVKVTTVSGNIIRVTAEHPFMRPNKTFTKASELKPNDVVLMEGAPFNAARRAEQRKLRPERKTVHSVPHHPFAWGHFINGKNYKRTHMARIVVEADMNCMTPDELISVLRNAPERAATLNYLDPSFIVHHIDGDCTNDAIDNLAVISKENHDAHHARETGLGTIATREDRIASIEPDGEEMTYDLVMKAPYHNYVANGFVVSNTGKGVLFHQIITPLLSEQNVVSKRMEELESEFTGYMENKFVVFIDEIEAGKSLYHSKITAKLKNLIVEPTISIRRMYSPPYMAPNFASMIFASNKPASVEIAPDDRRFNVGPYQNSAIQLTSTEVDIAIPKELTSFFAYLKQYKADADRARKPLQSAARDTLIDISRTALDTVSDAILAGDLEFLWEHLSTATKVHAMNPLQALKYQPFRDLVVELVNTLDPKLTRDDLYTIMEWCVGGMPQSPHKLAALLKHYRLHLTQVWKNNRNVRGIDVIWNPDPAWLAQAKLEIANGDV